MEGVKNKTFVMYESFYKSIIEDIPEDDKEARLECFMKLCEIGFYGREPTKSNNPIVNVIIKMATPNIVAAKDRHEAAIQNGMKGKEHGIKGGRPRNGETPEQAKARREAERDSETASTKPLKTPEGLIESQEVNETEETPTTPEGITELQELIESEKPLKPLNIDKDIDIDIDKNIDNDIIDNSENISSNIFSLSDNISKNKDKGTSGAEIEEVQEATLRKEVRDTIQGMDEDDVLDIILRRCIKMAEHKLKIQFLDFPKGYYDRTVMMLRECRNLSEESAASTIKKIVKDMMSDKNVTNLSVPPKQTI